MSFAVSGLNATRHRDTPVKRTRGRAPFRSLRRQEPLVTIRHSDLPAMKRTYGCESAPALARLPPTVTVFGCTETKR